MYKVNIDTTTIKNKHYRRVLYTTQDLQLVVMNLKPGQEIGAEKHNGTQFIRIEDGLGQAVVKGKKYNLLPGTSLIIKPHTKHNIIASDIGLKLYTIYSPPEHEDKLVEHTKI